MGPPFDDLSLEFELNDGDRFLHAGQQKQFGFIHPVDQERVIVHLGHELRAGVVPVNIESEGNQGDQIDPIPVFQGFHVVVAERDADDIGDTGQAAGRGAHPDDIVIPPLDIDRMVVEQFIEDDMGSRPPIVNIADDVQMGDGEALNQLGEGDGQLGALTHGDNRADERLVVAVSIPGRFVGGEQILDDIGKNGRQQLADIGARVF